MGCQTSSLAQNDRDPNREFDKVTGALVIEAQKLAGSAKYDEAISKLKDAQSQPDLIPYESSTISSILGSYAYEIDDIPGAIGHFKDAIHTNGLIPSEENNLKANIARLLIENGNYAEGAKMLVDWMAVNDEKPKYINYTMQAFVKAGDYASAMPLAEKWFALNDPSEPRPADILLWLKSELANQKMDHNLFAENIVCY